MKITITIETGVRDGIAPMTITRKELERFATEQRRREEAHERDMESRNERFRKLFEISEAKLP